MNIRLAVITVLIYSGLAVVIFFISLWMSNSPIKASVYPRTIEINTPISFIDSTTGASKTLWEFGNGDKSLQAKGSYTFKKEGNYLIRLTVNDKQKDTFLVHVYKPAPVNKKDSSVAVNASKTGVMGEKLQFKALGSGIEWCEWYFGETGKIDARTTEAFHSFSSPGVFTVRLITNLNPQKPLFHTIKIGAPYKVAEPIKPTPSKGGSKQEDKLKTSIQAIANGGSFHTYYNFVVNKYLCSNPRTPVIVNSKPAIDFYSYCQSLQLSTEVKIDLVNPEINPKTNCPSKLIITQH